MLKLSTPITQIPRIQKRYQSKLAKLGIKRLEDLLFHIPARYDDFSRFKKIQDVEIGETVSIQGRVHDIENIRTWKKRMTLTEAIIEDDTGSIKVIWFNQSFLIRNIKKGDMISLSGKVTFSHDSLFLSSPSYEVIRMGSSSPTHTAGLVAVYPETAGITSRYLRYLIKALLPKTEVKDFLPETIKKEQRLVDLGKALLGVHSPKTLREAKDARHRLEFNELFLLQLFMLRERQKIKKEKSSKIPTNLERVKAFTASLPFTLTNDQKIAAWEILKDTEKETPMNRLLEGDVGSGKTVVAALAAGNAAHGGFQTAFMAPTEILAEQHFHEFTKLLSPFGITCALLTGNAGKIWDSDFEKLDMPRKDILAMLDQGEVHVITGTHALIEQRLSFKRLGLVVIDEQHRFGVEQRAKLTRQQEGKSKGTLPHFLSMSATPIPRTLALTIYGDLDISIIKEMPKERQKIITKIIPPALRKETYEFIRREIASGRQVFVICPLIEESEILEAKAATKEYERLSQEVFPHLKLGLLHGKIKPKEKERVMQDFKKGNVDILVSTSVVEVGIDIPNATVMLIEGAERFGLAQLHQFRGRVGRGKHQSTCFLFTDSSAQKTALRLKALVKAENGFELAEKDLAIRGPGDFTGVRQSGLPDISMTSLSNIALVKATKKEASLLLENDSGLNTHPALKEKLEEFERMIHLE